MTGVAFESVLKRDRAVVAAGLVAVVAIAWGYLWFLTAGMEGMGGMAGLVTAPRPWGGVLDFALMFVMWTAMMVAMMLPGAAPMILLFATINRKKRAAGEGFVPTGIFALGYLVMWSGFSLLAVVLQFGLQQAALVSPAMTSASTMFSGVLFVAAGVYQWTPLKHVCLKHCRSPLDFVLHHWREGTGGAFRMGLQHGLFCLGCCWVLMGLLFAVGVMNLVWVAAIAALVMAEKVVPRGELVARLSGVAMFAAGIYLLAAG